MDDLYLWLKTLHIVSVIFWMAGLLYLPRLMAYNAAARDEPDSEVKQGKCAMLNVMQQRLMKIIMTPAMMSTWIFGLSLVFYDPSAIGGWFVLKFVFIVFLSGLHSFLAARNKAFAANNCISSATFYRRLNEVPALTIVVVVALAVIKPF